MLCVWSVNSSWYLHRLTVFCSDLPFLSIKRTSNYTVFDWDGAGIHGQPGEQNGWDVHGFHAEEALVPNIRQLCCPRLPHPSPGTWNLQVDAWPGKGRHVEVHLLTQFEAKTTCGKLWPVGTFVEVSGFSWKQVTGVEVWRMRPVQGACGAQKYSTGEFGGTYLASTSQQSR